MEEMESDESFSEEELAALGIDITVIEEPEVEEPKEPEELYFADDSIYTAFKEQVHNPRSVLYPSCGIDASPARVFDNVTFVDKECVQRLREAGFKALKMDIQDYKPEEEHDALILLNPSIPSEWGTRHLVRGGYVIANNYHGNARELFHDPGFTLWGVIDVVTPRIKGDNKIVGVIDFLKPRITGDNKVVVSQDISDLFVPARNMEELRESRPTDYDFIVDSYTSRLRLMNIEPEKDPDKLFFQFHEAMGENVTRLPAKRQADRYIFVKK